jgi:hypothetical protein
MRDKPARYFERPRPAAWLALVLLVLLVACNRLVPSGFWKSYRSELIQKQYSDQGPWGGERWLFWSASKSGVLSEHEVSQFATDHGWRFVRRFAVPAGTLRKSPAFDAAPDPASSSLPAFINGDSMILKFDSGWMFEDAGTNEMTTAHGYVQISADGRQMVVFHAWGNW